LLNDPLPASRYSPDESGEKEDIVPPLFTRRLRVEERGREGK
jgi:hypothetical protein